MVFFEIKTRGNKNIVIRILYNISQEYLNKFKLNKNNYEKYR